MKEYKVIRVVLEDTEETFLNKAAAEGWVLKSSYTKSQKNPINGVVHDYVYFVLERDKQ